MLPISCGDIAHNRIEFEDDSDLSIQRISPRPPTFIHLTPHHYRQYGRRSSRICVCEHHQEKSHPTQTNTSSNSSKRRKFVADGVFYAELNEFFQRELAEEGYSGVEVRVTPTVTDIIIRATHTQEVLGEQGRRIRELTSLIQKRFKFPENSVSLYAAKVQNRGLSAVAQCESLRYKLLNGLAVRRACYGVLRFIMESGAKGCEVVVSGKLRAARAKSMKFTVRL